MKKVILVLLVYVSFIEVVIAKSCSVTPLKVIFINGQSELSDNTYLISQKLKDALNGHATIDQKGTGVVLYKFQNFANDYKTQFDFMVAAFRAIAFGKEKAAAAALMFIAGSAFDFINLYGEESFEHAEKKYGELLSGLGLRNYLEAVDQQYELVRDNSYNSQKLMIVSHGLSGIVADGVLKRLHKFEPANDNILHFMFSPLRKKLGSEEFFATKYISIIDDPFQASQLTILYFSSYPPTLKTAGVRNRSFSKIFDGYLSNEAKSLGFGPNQKSNFNNLNSLKEISNATETFYGNDNICCNKRPGSLWIKKVPYRDDEGEEQVSESFGGFIEDGIDYDKTTQDLRVDPAAIVCKSLAYNNGTPQISGNVDIKGNVILGDSSSIEGGSSFSSPIYLDSLGKTIELRGTTKIKNDGGAPLMLKGSVLSVGNTLLSGKLDIIGVDYSAFSIPNYKTAFNNAKISGKTVIRGPVLISGKVIDSEITGTSDNQNILLIDSAADVESAKISGLGTIAAEVKDKAVIEGERVGTRSDGVVLLNGETKKTRVTGAGTRVRGIVNVMRGAEIKSGSYVWGKYTAVNQGAVSITASLVEGSTVIGRGAIGDNLNLIRSVVEGCRFFLQFTDMVDSKLYGVGFLNTPLNNQVIGVKENAYDGCDSLDNSFDFKNKYNGGPEYNRLALYNLFGY